MQDEHFTGFLLYMVCGQFARSLYYQIPIVDMGFIAHHRIGDLENVIILKRRDRIKYAIPIRAQGYWVFRLLTL